MSDLLLQSYGNHLYLQTKALANTKSVKMFYNYMLNIYTLRWVLSNANRYSLAFSPPA